MLAWENYEKSGTRVRTNFPIDDTEVKRPWGGDLNPKRGNDPEERGIAPAHRGSVCSSFPSPFFMFDCKWRVLSLNFDSICPPHAQSVETRPMCPSWIVSENEACETYRYLFYLACRSVASMFRYIIQLNLYKFDIINVIIIRKIWIL